MSSKGLFTALSGAMAQNQRLDTIANNIANANTTAFKKDQQTFYEYLTAAEKPVDVIQVPRIPASIESFYDMQGADRAYVDSAGTFVNLNQGQLKPTSAPLDLALDGPGFFEVLTPQGVRYTRSGQFKIDNQKNLVTKDGFPVLKEGTQDPQQRKITVDGKNLVVTSGGDVFDGANSIGKISIVEQVERDSLQKMGGSLYSLKGNLATAASGDSERKMIPSVETQIHQGFVELSNVNIVDEMTDMIAASRTFEAAQKAMKAYDQMDEKLNTEVPKI
ncbi:MAG: flagellar basal-body rod protein FlgF [Bdellovibrionales bacterium]|nr:flagellar basal-body rod protein FlgF [Bdellovibrionales bacterium]